MGLMEAFIFLMNLHRHEVSRQNPSCGKVRESFFRIGEAMTNLELLPCPFCGGESVLYVEMPYSLLSFGNETFERALIRCKKCSLEANWGYSRNETVREWNSRALPKTENERT